MFPKSLGIYSDKEHSSLKILDNLRVNHRYEEGDTSMLNLDFIVKMGRSW